MIGYFRDQIQCLNCDVLAAIQCTSDSIDCPILIPNAMLGLVCGLANIKEWLLFYAVDVIEVNGQPAMFNCYGNNLFSNKLIKDTGEPFITKYPDKYSIESEF